MPPTGPVAAPVLPAGLSDGGSGHPPSASNPPGVRPSAAASQAASDGGASGAKPPADRVDGPPGGADPDRELPAPEGTVPNGTTEPVGPDAGAGTEPASEGAESAAPTAPAEPAPGDGDGGVPDTTEPAAAEPVDAGVADPVPVDGTTPPTDVGGSAAEPDRAARYPVPIPPVTRAPAGSAFGYPASYSDAPGTGQFQFALPQLGTILAGPAVGSLVAGVAACVVIFAVGCAGLLGNTMITVAVTVLEVFCASTAGLLAGVAFRQIRRGDGEYRGRGMAMAGMVCGASALAVVLLLLMAMLAW